MAFETDWTLRRGWWPAKESPLVALHSLAIDHSDLDHGGTRIPEQHDSISGMRRT